MKLSVRLSELLGPKAAQRGIVNEICHATGIERHTVAALLHNRVKYIALDTLARLATYLAEKHGADVRSLVGALFAPEPEPLWDVLADAQQLTFCLGARMSREWAGSEYVMSTDAQLQGRMLSQIARAQLADGSRSARREGAAERRPFPSFCLLRAPMRRTTPQDPGEAWPAICREAQDFYEAHRDDRHAGVVALGSPKVNTLVELMFARAFALTPFRCRDRWARARDRRCPLFFRWRDTDPQPPSCCGGLVLGDDTSSVAPGIYYETADGSWASVECDPHVSDAAFLFYAYRPPLAQAEVACGGFSSLATHWMANELETIVAAMGEPQYASRKLKLGLYVIRFTFFPTSDPAGSVWDARKPRVDVIPISRRAIQRGLKGRS